MSRKDLKNKPLIEAILELRWTLPTQPAPGIATDSHYRILLGRFFERVRAEYGTHEPLPTASIPDEMVAQMVQHRFRVGTNAWPLLQLGPGILTVNETAGYTWPLFRNRCEDAVAKLVDAHPTPEELRVDHLTLRYIDSVVCDFAKESVFDFLKNMMKTTVALPSNLFENENIDRNPVGFNWQVTFPLKRPNGTTALRFATGQREGQPALIWETLVVSTGSEVPKIPEHFSEWIGAAHDITDDLFFNLIEGELERRFSGE